MLFGRFTERAQKVLALAQEEAVRLGHNSIGTEHILLGLVREGDGIAAKALVALGTRIGKNPKRSRNADWSRNGTDWQYRYTRLAPKK